MLREASDVSACDHPVIGHTTDNTQMNINNPRNHFRGFRGHSGDRFRKFLRTYVYRILGYSPDILLVEWEDFFSHVEKHEGTLNAVKVSKDIYNFALRWSCGISADPLPFRKSYKDGFPKAISNFRTYLEKSPDSRRAALTILQLYKLVDVEPPYTLDSITTPYAGQANPVWIDKFKTVVEREFPSSQQQYRISQLRPGFHISGSNGPNGPVIGTAFVDRKAIRNASFENSVKALSAFTGFNYLYELLESTQVDIDIKSKKQRIPAHSRIRIKYEPGGKARPFAIIDFFSQSALKSIHSFTMSWLKGRETDGTSNHSIAADAVREWTNDSSEPLWSYDLTNATDRFPIFLQEIVLEQMFGNTIKELWKDIIINRDFIGPKGEKVRWMTGQPLGALSSWSVFAITHHLLLQTAFYDSSGRNHWFNKYRLIGDDICIKSMRVSQKYRSYLQDLDVNISVNKSVLPEQCSRGNAGELAKRLFHQGYEVTPVPPLGIKEGFENPIGFRNLIETSWKRGYLGSGSPYPVQSILTSKLEYAMFTFPFRNKTPQFKGLRSLFPSWKVREKAPAGLNPNWFIWSDFPDELLTETVRRFLFRRVDKAVRESMQIQQQVLVSRYSKSERAELPQGGDWQPDAFGCYPEILTEVFSELQETMMICQQRLWSEGFLEGDPLDLYAFIGSLHRYLEPKLLLQGRSQWADEKQLTAVFVSQLVKYCAKFDKSKDYTELNEPLELEDFPMLDHLGFAPVYDF